MGDLGDRDRMPFQVLVIPYRRIATRIRYAAFLRTDASVWQFIAGGGSRGETKLQAARREAQEEAGVPPCADFVQLQSVASVPAHNFRARRYWPPNLSEIPEYCFAVNAGGVSRWCRSADASGCRTGMGQSWPPHLDGVCINRLCPTWTHTQLIDYDNWTEEQRRERIAANLQKRILQLPILVGGAVIMENIFALPGLGRPMLDALQSRDYPVVQGTNLFFATGVVLLNLLIDLIYPYLDPRVRYG